MTKKNKKAQKKSIKVKQEKNVFEGISPMFYSEFCLTDNKEFAFYDIDDQFLIDNHIDHSVLNIFRFTENDFVMEIDRNKELSPKKGIQKVCFDFGQKTTKRFVKREIFDLVESYYPKRVFHPLKTYNDKRVNSIVIALSEKYGKVIALFNLIEG